MVVETSSPRRVVAGLVFALIGLLFMLEGLTPWTLQLVWIWPILLIGLGASTLLGRVQRIKVEEDRSAQIAVAEERVRIARELHDIVAHSVSLMTVQIAAARRVFKKKPDSADQAMAAAEATGRESLAELRNIVSVLRGADASLEAASRREATGEKEGAALTPLPSLGEIAALIDGVKDTGLAVDFKELGVVPEVSPGVGLAVYRVVQEALTNVIRHSGAKRVEVSLIYLPAMIEVLVQDDGKGVEPAARMPRDGHGIMGMRERVSAVGGSVTSLPRTPGPGWEVRAEIPV